MASILIAGCGFVGNALASQLIEDGDSVFGLRRDVTKLATHAQAVVGDLSGNRPFEGLPNSLDAVVFTAAPDESSDEAYRTIYVEGLRRVLRETAAIKHAPRRLVLVSSTSIYAQSDGQVVDESSATAPTRFSGRRLLESEQVARESGLTTTSLRFGGIYGPGRTALIERVDRSEATLTAAPSYTNRIHRDDCAGAIRHLLRLSSPPECIVGVDDDPADRNDVISWLAERLGISLAPPTDGEIGSRNKRCSNALLREIGYEFRYPSYRDGYPAIVREYLDRKRARD